MNDFDNAAALSCSVNSTRQHRGEEHQPARELLEQIERHLKTRLGNELNRMPRSDPGMDEDFTRLRTHYKNICRYRELLATSLTSAESEFVERRLAEEHFAVEALMSAVARPCD
ncbi:hypothetical protein AYJ54_43460 [Bradyrhizobium centrolobii]|uniref:Uncharacterized protein n=1 Tax=Bradyrhizobium centrolobii TaxID=1505087 RepID=A0A176Z117_9BRAD|nr:hypothetical protein [Bradyrhizobium centrolobii]OAF13590.1 hypothetical protein AYJ54_43460 [Bradyrhizobium centrolobii]